MLCLFSLCLFVQTKTDSIFADQDKPLTESCRLAERIQGSNILLLPWNASNHRNGVISLNRVKEPYTPLRLKSYQEYIEILWIRIVLKGIGVVVSLTTQAAALITFGKWGLRKYQASHTHTHTHTHTHPVKSNLDSCAEFRVQAANSCKERDQQHSPDKS